MNQLENAMANMQVDGRAFAFLLKRFEVLKQENETLRAQILHPPALVVEQNVLETSRIVAKLTVEAKSNASVTLNSKLKNLLPKPDKLETLRALLSANPQSISTWRDTNTGASMLHVAAENGNLQACKMLVEDFAHELDLLDLCGRTSLHLAAWKQYMPVCEFLAGRMVNGAKGAHAPVDMAGYTPAALSALAMNSYDYDPDKQREYEQVRRSVKRFLHVKGDASVSPRRLAALNRSTGAGKSKLRMQQQPDDGTLAFGMFLMNGWGIKMEDFCFAASPVDDNMEEGLSVFGVFDGHGGALCAKQCTEMLPGLLATQSLLSSNDTSELVEFAQSIVHGLELGLQAMPQFAWRQVEIRPAMGNEPALLDWQIGDGSGTTCVLAFVTRELLCVAHVGDSRSCLVSAEEGGDDFALTRDHKLTVADENFVRMETERIERVGGYVINGKRVSVDKEGKTSLGMTRSLGDFWAKRNTLENGEQVVSAQPEVYISARPTYDALLMLASDGIWDVVTEKQVGQFIRANLDAAMQAHGMDRTLALHQLANDLCDHCLELDSQDNMSVVIVDLPSNVTRTPMRKPVFE